MLKTMSRFLFGTLRGRLIIGVAVVHAVMMSLFIGDLTIRQRAMLMNRQIEEATALTQALATSAGEWIATDDISGLQELVDAQRRYPEVLFAILADNEGRVLADSDKSRQGLYMTDLPRVARQSVFSRTPSLVDVAVPAMIGGHHVGWARVGIGQKVAGEKLAKITRNGVAYALAAIFIGSLIAWFIGRRITRRLYAVQDTIKAIRSGNRAVRSSITGVDEPAVIAREFNSMLDALEERNTELCAREEKYRALIESANDAVFIHEIKEDGMPGPFIEVNELAYKRLGYSREELAMLSPMELDDPCYRNRIQDAMERLLKDGHAVFETAQIAKDGRSIPVEVSTRVIEVRGKRLLFSLVRDITERKKAEESLRQRDAELNESQRLAHIGSWDWDALNDTIWWSDEYYRIYGIHPKQPSPNYVEHLKVYTPESSQRLDVAVKRAMETGEPYEVDLELARPIPGTQWIVARGEAKRDASGKICGLRGTAQNITERKRADDAFFEAQRVFRTLVENSPDIIARYDRDCRRTYVNPAYLKTAQIRQNELLATSPIHRSPLPAASATILQNLLRRVLDSGVAETVDVIWPKADNLDYWYNIYAFPEFDREGQVVSVMTVSRDITDRKRAVGALETSEAKMRSIMDNIGIGVSLISPKMEILEMNQQMRKWFPAVDPSQHPICYRALNDPPREAVCDYCPTCKTLQDGLVHEDTSQTPQAGAIRNYRIVSSPVLSASGEVTAATEIVEDITEKLELESQFRQAQKMESVGRLAGGVAHDFNNMLSVILGHTEMLLDSVDPAQSIHVDLSEIRNAARRSADITRQLLAFARKQTISPRIIDLNETIEGMLKMLRRLIGEDIDIAWMPARGLWPVKVDPGQIDQILANLAINARDAIAGTGKVTIETENAVFDEAYCADHTGFVPGEYVTLAVSDDGCGMEKDVLSNIFEPFFTTKGVGEGTGLGLSTVYGIVKQNNGFINVYSEPGKGSTFKIYIPQFQGQSDAEQMKALREPTKGAGETVLLVEDELSVLKLNQRLLERLRYKVLPASTPHEAIRLAEEHAGQIDLLITDVVMPEMNGLDLAKQLLSTHPNLKQLFMSGYTANAITHRNVLKEGVHFIHKPFSTQDLAIKVREALTHQED